MPISRAAYFFIHTIFKKLIFRRLQTAKLGQKTDLPSVGG